jgi:uncharacterized small protein (DUF1192 family)
LGSEEVKSLHERIALLEQQLNKHADKLNRVFEIVHYHGPGVIRHVIPIESLKSLHERIALLE